GPAFRVGLGMDVGNDRNASAWMLDRDVIADDEGDEIRRVREILAIVIDELVLALVLRDEHAVREREEPRGDVRNDLGLRFLVWIIKTREPVPAIVVLSLRPHFRGPVVPELARGAEVHAAP